MAVRRRDACSRITSGQEFTVESTPGRHRLNINGAIDALDVTKLVIGTDERINAASTIALLRQVQRGTRKI